MDSAAPVVFKHAERHVVLDVSIDADDRHGQGDDFGDESQRLPGSGGVELDGHGVGLGRLVQVLVRVRPVHLDGHHGLRRVIVQVAIVQGQLVRHPRLAAAVDKVVLEHPEAHWLDVVYARENLDAID